MSLKKGALVTPEAAEALAAAGLESLVVARLEADDVGQELPSPGAEHAALLDGIAGGQHLRIVRAPQELVARRDNHVEVLEEEEHLRRRLSSLAGEQHGGPHERGRGASATSVRSVVLRSRPSLMSTRPRADEKAASQRPRGVDWRITSLMQASMS